MECWYVPDSVLIHSSHAVGKANPADAKRIHAMHRASVEIYREEWGVYCRQLGRSSIAFVLPDFNSACGGARVVGALARQLSICGVRSEVFVRRMNGDCDSEFPHFRVRPIEELNSADIVIATRFDTLKEAKAVRAGKRYYFVQQIEDVMAHNCGGTKEQALASYLDQDFEIITIGEHLAARLKAMGRDSVVLDVGFYRDTYPLVRRKARDPKRLRVLMYGMEDYKGPDQSAIADAIRKSVPGSRVNSFHRFGSLPRWSDKHFRPETTAEVAKVYADHDLYVYASSSDGFAMTPIESMACGTPVVLTDFPGKDQYARSGENCLVVPFRDVKAVALAVKRIVEDPALWNRLVDDGAKTADRYDWSRVGAQYARTLLGAPA
jgi:glycosyltransferase involved in cell wall biosynthesis